MSFRATVVMLISLVTVLLFSCKESNPSSPDGDETDTYTVSYNGNGNTGGNTPESQTKEKSVKLKLSGDTGNLVKTGYTFDGWNTKENGSGTDYAAGASYTNNANLALYAKWSSGGIIAGPTVTDADGNVYTSIVIGTQTWTVENLRTTKYNDGTDIPHVTESGESGGTTGWWNLTTGAYCYYDNNPYYKDKYGALYNWYAINTKKLAPEGWHVPTDADWDTLQNYLIANGYNWDGTTTGNKIAKSMGAKTDWNNDTISGTIGNDLSKNNAIGFTALPCGYRGGDGFFYAIGDGGGWWSATKGGASSTWCRTLGYNRKFLRKDNYYKGCGYSVRLLRD